MLIRIRIYGVFVQHSFVFMFVFIGWPNGGSHRCAECPSPGQWRLPNILRISVSRPHDARPTCSDYPKEWTKRGFRIAVFFDTVVFRYLFVFVRGVQDILQPQTPSVPCIERALFTPYLVYEITRQRRIKIIYFRVYETTLSTRKALNRSQCTHTYCDSLITCIPGMDVCMYTYICVRSCDVFNFETSIKQQSNGIPSGTGSWGIRYTAAYAEG